MDAETRALIPRPEGGAVEPDLSPAERLLRAFLSARSRNTARAYSRDLEHFAAWCRVPTPGEAARLLLAGSHGHANEVALRYKGSMLEEGLAPATVNRRLAALRSLVKLARVLGQVSWQLEVEGVRSESYRDTRGPGREGVRRLFEAAAGRAVLRL